MQKSVLLTVMAYMVPVLLLWLLNLPKRIRYRQFWAPCAALFIAIAVIAISHLYLDYLRALLVKVLDLLQFQMQPPTLPKLVNWLVLAVFLVLKGLINGWTLISATVRRWCRIVKGRLTGQVVEEGAEPTVDEPVSPPLGYERLPGLGIMLRHEFFFAGDVFNMLAVLSCLLLAACVTADPQAISLPHLPALAVLLLCETAWYLQGLRMAAAGISADSIQITSSGFSDLWEKYQQIWSGKVLAAVQLNEANETPNNDTAYEIVGRLRQGENLLIPALNHTPLLQDLFRYVWENLVDGRKVLLLVDGRGGFDAAFDAVSGVVQDRLASVARTGPSWTIFDYDTMARSNESPDIMVATPSQLSRQYFGPLENTWFAQVRLILIPDVSSTFENMQDVHTLLHALADRHRHTVQLICLSGAREFPETALRRNLSAEMKEHALKNPLPCQKQIILWRREGGKSFQNHIMHQSSKHLGAETVLSSLAWAYKVKPVLQLFQDTMPFYQRAEELQNHLNQKFFQGYDMNANFEGVATSPETFDYRHSPWMWASGKAAFVVLTDHTCNLASTLNQGLTQATHSAFVHVVSAPYLLREYFAANIEYFQRTPLLPMTPRISTAPFTVAIDLLTRMSMTPMDSKEILAGLRQVDETVICVKDGVRRLFLRMFGIDILANNLLLQEKKSFLFDDQRKVFEEEGAVYYSLSKKIFEVAEAALSWMRRYQLVDVHSKTMLAETCLDHLFQSYLPQQVHAFRGNPYLIRSIDHARRVVNLEFKHDMADRLYRPHLCLRFGSLSPPANIALSKVSDCGGWRVAVDLCEAFITISTEGYSTFTDKITVNDFTADYTPMTLQEVPDREYRSARVLKMRFSGHQLLAGHQRIAFTLATLINELMVTMFPETHRFLHAGTLVLDPNTFLGDTPGLARIMPQMTLDAGDIKRIRRDVASSETGDEYRLDSLRALKQEAETGVLLLFVEDSHSDVGLAQCLFDEWTYLFDILYDYLVWVDAGETPSKVGDWRKKDFVPYDYLCYGKNRVPPELDLDAVLGFLRSLGVHERRDSLNSQRSAFYSGELEGAALTINPEVTTTSVASEGTVIGFGDRGEGLRQCDFCGCSLPAKDMQLIDGVLDRCPECSRMAVADFSELVAIYREARTFLEKRIGVSLRDSIDVTFASTVTIQEEAETAFVPTSRLDPRALGVAIYRGENRTILVENGSPYHSILVTTVHELTHIWQYDALDFKRLKEEQGLLWVEGLAMWAEIECLTKKKLAPQLCAHEKSRGDVYGQGYRALALMLKQNPKYRNPFEIVLERYKI